MSQSAPSIPASARASFGLVLLALVGGLLTMWLTRDTNVSADAVASVAVAVIGVAGVHIGHVTGHYFGKEPAGRMHRNDGFGLVVMSVTAMLGLVAIVSVGYTRGIIYPLRPSRHSRQRSSVWSALMLATSQATDSGSRRQSRSGLSPNNQAQVPLRRSP